MSGPRDRVGGSIVMFNVPSAVPFEPLAVTVTGKLPSVVGVPEITPVDEFTTKPGGNDVAVKDVGLVLAVI